MSLLKGKRAIVIGAGRDPGRGIAHRFVREGARVFVIDREAVALRTVADELGATGSVADPADHSTLLAAIDAALSRLGGVDILVNAVLEEPAWERLEALSDGMFEQQLRRSFYSTLWSMQAVLPAMRAAGGGRIINVGSIYGENVAEFIGAYAVAAEAVRALTRTAAQEWGQHGILVNVLMPTIDSKRFAEYRARHQASVDSTLPLVALQRFGDPVEDIGGAAVFLAGDDGRYLTGYTLHADGGYHMAGPVYVPVLEDKKQI